MICYYVCGFPHILKVFILYYMFSIFLLYEKIDQGGIELEIFVSLVHLVLSFLNISSLFTTLYIYHYNLDQATIVNHKDYCNIFLTGVSFS